jgi:hypothetical protein
MRLRKSRAAGATGAAARLRDCCVCGWLRCEWALDGAAAVGFAFSLLDPIGWYRVVCLAATRQRDRHSAL